MQQNVQIVSSQIANAAARRASGRNFLNATAYSYASWSLGLGLAALIPFLGVVFGAIGIFLGLASAIVISNRGLPHGKIRAIAGMVLSVAGFAVTIGLIFLMSRHR